MRSPCRFLARDDSDKQLQLCGIELEKNTLQGAPTQQKAIPTGEKEVWFENHHTPTKCVYVGMIFCILKLINMASVHVCRVKLLKKQGIGLWSGFSKCGL